MPRDSHLRRLLEALKPADALEHTHRQRTLALLAETSAPFSRAQSLPGHVTASAFIANPARDALLLILHAKFEIWLQPGGHVEPGDETVLAAAQREMHEELGIDVAALQVVGDGLLDVDVHRIAARGDEPAHEHFDVRFLFSTAADSFKAGSDAAAARWVPIAWLLAQTNALGLPLPTDASVLRAVRKIVELRAWD